MKKHKIGIIMNGVTGRMGTNQHLLRSIAAFIQEGGLPIAPGEVIVPDPILVGRNADKLKKLCSLSGVEKCTTDLDACLKDKSYQIYFDAQITGLRAASVRKAIEAGKHIYCEKPTATDTQTAMELYRLCTDAGLKNGVVQDKLWLPGLVKLRRLKENGFFGSILTVRIEFGYWVFEGHSIPAQRPSWNYRKEDEGGLVLDMMPHWRYILDNLFGNIQAVSCLAATHIKERVDEAGNPYRCTAEDAAYSTFELDGGIIVHINASWATRVRRDDLLCLQVDGTKGSAVAGLRSCFIQHYGSTPRPVWNPDTVQETSYLDDWAAVPDQEDYTNAFRAQWEQFLRHVVLDEPFPWNLLEGAKGVQLSECATRSWQERKWVDVPELNG
ncbi:MAG: oxidoreductase [Deltaproteobacteria bacterium SG8_13]|nr:MAG: oxidoreductase [Deltaproteobacteria bacterium SG8_13]